MRCDQLEGLAETILRDARCGSPVDAFLLADSLGFRLTPAGSTEEGVFGLELRFNARLPHREQQESVMRMLARALLDRAGFYPSDHACARLTRALMLPRDAFAYDMRDVASFEALAMRHVHASEPLIAARAAELHTMQRRERRLSAPALASSSSRS